MSAPPFFDRFIPQRQCGRAVRVDGTQCGAEPFLHVCWEDTPEGIEHGFVCTSHAPRDLAQWPPVVHNGVSQVHVLGPDCGLPGARWFLDENICRVPDESEPVEARAEDLAKLTIGQAA